MGKRLTDGEKVVVSVFGVMLAGCVSGLFFVGGAILDIKDSITEVKVTLVGMQRDIADLREDVDGLREDVDGLREEMSERMSAVEEAIETHHGSRAQPSN